jgi:hypothetical protein
VGSPQREPLMRTIRGLAAADELPRLEDTATLRPPVMVCWFCRVGAENLWVVYTFSDTHLFVRAVVNQPPLPLDGPAKT